MNKMMKMRMKDLRSGLELILGVFGSECDEILNVDNKSLFVSCFSPLLVFQKSLVNTKMCNLKGLGEVFGDVFNLSSFS